MHAVVPSAVDLLVVSMVSCMSLMYAVDCRSATPALANPSSRVVLADMHVVVHAVVHAFVRAMVHVALPLCRSTLPCMDHALTSSPLIHSYIDMH